ncbi:Gibberellin 2-beta-dioxygenase 8 [Phytophthora nicotianae]|uniref:Gibberellin 2-beta-dioxygenase 8 n=1 Tax=Phytophthora nicotianae TaxID=4792 RepID=A0A0W8CTS2_PHYNI|nr:Gibberellin 2-beta-dioxygenase 8 [Phytophthora nicotianae]
MDVRQVPMVDVAALIAFPNDVEVDAALRAKDGDPRKIVEEIGAAANEWGFFYIANHGLSEQEMAKFQKAMRSFFDLPRTLFTVRLKRGPTYTINIGDMVQVWSNDQFVAPLHRVLANGGADRFSAPFFYNPSYKAQVEPIVMKPGDVANYRQLSWGEFRLRRYQGNVTDKGKEIQIGDFKVRGPIDVANS